MVDRDRELKKYFEEAKYLPVEIDKSILGPKGRIYLLGLVAPLLLIAVPAFAGNGIESRVRNFPSQDCVTQNETYSQPSWGFFDRMAKALEKPSLNHSQN